MDESGPVQVEEDQSLTADAYLAQGMPATDRPWSHTDYQAAAGIVERLAKTNPKQLPRWQSPNSATVLARMTSEENFAQARNRAVPINQRFPAALECGPAIQRMTLAYITATNRGKSFDAELVELMSFMLRWATVCTDLAKEFQATLTPQEAASPVRKQGLEKMRTGYSQMVTGLLMTFTEKKTYRTSQLVRMAVLSKPLLPGLVKELPSLTQKEVPVRLQSLIDNEADPTLKQALTELLQAVKAN
jgi:hypothetical protein